MNSAVGNMIDKAIQIATWTATTTGDGSTLMDVVIGIARLLS